MSRLILASTSPRRQQLMREIGFNYEVVKPTSEELERKGEAPAKMVARLCREKAENVKEQIRESRPDVIIVAADTTVVDPTGRRVLNKPTDVEHAKKMLRTIGGRTHTVLTGYTILELRNGRLHRSHTRIVKTRVKMRKLTPAKIAEYVASGEPMDKAGSYGAQGIGMCLIESITGSYSNVVGLPMAELVDDLEKKFKLLPVWKRP